jgi:hypothetical protein
MRAARYQQTGPAAKVLEVADVERPEPGPGEVRVALVVSGVNPTDWKRRSGATAAPPMGWQIPPSRRVGNHRRGGARGRTVPGGRAGVGVVGGRYPAVGHGGGVDCRAVGTGCAPPRRCVLRPRGHAGCAGHDGAPVPVR